MRDIEKRILRGDILKILAGAGESLGQLVLKRTLEYEKYSLSDHELEVACKYLHRRGLIDMETYSKITAYIVEITPDGIDLVEGVAANPAIDLGY